MSLQDTITIAYWDRFLAHAYPGKERDRADGDPPSMQGDSLPHADHQAGHHATIGQAEEHGEGVESDEVGRY